LALFRSKPIPDLPITPITQITRPAADCTIAEGYENSQQTTEIEKPFGDHSEDEKKNIPHWHSNREICSYVICVIYPVDEIPVF